MSGRDLFKNYLTGIPGLLVLLVVLRSAWLDPSIIEKPVFQALVLLGLAAVAGKDFNKRD
jgi:hypothetical protein